MDHAAARVVQITDTHFSAAAGEPPAWRATLDWLHRDPPDLVVHTGDIVREDPDDEPDRALAARLLADVPAPLLCVPGNHDIGEYGEDGARARRVDAFRRAFGHDHFVSDLAGWRLVGANAYLLGQPDHDEWLATAVDAAGPVLVFIHQPVGGDPADGWEMPRPAAAAFERAVARGDVRVVASGHRHCAAAFGRAVWAPSLTLVGTPLEGCDPRPGLVEHHLRAGGHHEHRVVRVPDAAPAPDPTP